MKRRYRNFFDGIFFIKNKDLKLLPKVMTILTFDIILRFMIPLLNLMTGVFIMVFASRQSLKKMDDATLDKKGAIYARLKRWGGKIASPPSFFGLLALSIAVPLLVSAVPATPFILLLMGGAAFASAALQFVGGTGLVQINDVKAERNQALQAAAPQDGPAPAVTLLPDLSDDFHRGITNPSTMKPLRLKTNTQQSAFLT